MSETVVAAIYEWARKDPARIAVEYNDEVWTYARFAQAIGKARAFFRRQGLEGEGVVVLAIGHVREAWVISAALRSLGLTTVSVQSPDLIAELGLPDIRAVVANEGEDWSGLAERAAEAGVPLITAAYADEEPLDLTDTDYGQGGHILQTSGTTGRYKKIFMDPAWEPAYLARRRAASGAGETDVVCLFDFALWTGVGYKSPSNLWIVGGVIIFSQHRPAHLQLRRMGMTHINMLPTMLTAVLAEPEGSFPYHPDGEVGIGGGAITQWEINEIRRRIAPKANSGLGATESHTIAITELNTPEDARWHQLDPHSTVELVDDEDRPVALGEIGRLRVATDGGPSGYLNDEEATRTFFKDGYFYTGDLAVMREDGRIALMGRFTDVISIRGHKLTPQPIEDALRDSLGVTGVCALSMPDERGEDVLHIAIETPAPIDAETLRTALSAAISGVPGVSVHFLKALPRNAMGKVVRRKLVAQLRSAGAGAAVPGAPAS